MTSLTGQQEGYLVCNSQKITNRDL